MQTKFFFQWVTQNHKAILIFSLLVMIGMGVFIPTMVKDTSTTAFIDPDNAVLIYRDKVKETFGLKDPLAIAVYNENSVYNNESLKLIADLGERLKTVEGIDPDQIRSIATENNIVGTEDGMDVNPFYEVDNLNENTAKEVENALSDFDLYRGSFVSEDGKLALIIAEVLEKEGETAVGAKAYKNILAMVGNINAGNNEIHVAGEGAISDYLTTYIDQDASRLNPMAGLIITIILIIAYLTLRGAIIPNIIVGGTVVISLGTMAALGIPFYVITNALPVVLIAIAVADSIHILGQYYEEVRDNPQLNQRDLIILSMTKIIRPVTVTSITTIAGFLGIALSSNMPPFRAFGIFAALGVFAAYIFSIFLIPSTLMFLKPQTSRAMGKSLDRPDFFSRFMSKAGKGVVKYPKTIVATAAAIVILGFIGALKLEVNYAPIRNFQPSELIVKADNIINAHTDGTSYLDIVVETPEAEGLYLPDNLKKIEKLQEFALTIPNVQGSTSIVDLIKKMNQSLNENQKSHYIIPDNDLLIAQEFLLYSASGQPTDFENFVDYDYQIANVRVAMNSPLFQDKKVVVNAMQNYMDEHFNDENIQASLSGNVALENEWLKGLGKNHFTGMGIALFLILMVTALSFRSFLAGVFTTIPVALSILLIYAVMGFGNIWLEIGTTMFAAIAIGVGVDFAVHTTDRLIFFIKESQLNIMEALEEFYKSTGRALLFNLLALAFGFGVLTTSIVPPLVKFGALVVVAVSTSFIASLTLLPALIYLVNPRFVRADNSLSKKYKREELQGE